MRSEPHTEGQQRRQIVLGFLSSIWLTSGLFIIFVAEEPDLSLYGNHVIGLDLLIIVSYMHSVWSMVNFRIVNCNNNGCQGGK